MNGSLRGALALALIVALPATTFAANRGSRGGGSRGLTSASSRSAPIHNRDGFNLPHDINASPVHTFQVQRPVTVNGHQLTHYVQGSANITGGPYRGHFTGPIIHNPRNWGGWGWNHGIAWYPAPIYWGGGFWGYWALDDLTAAILFGSIIDYQNEVIYLSYEVEPYSPGSQFLQNYGLQQAPCGPPNLAMIWGPYNSVICAYPNTLVAPGNYQLDPTTLTITSSP